MSIDTQKINFMFCSFLFEKVTHLSLRENNICFYRILAESFRGFKIWPFWSAERNAFVFCHCYILLPNSVEGILYKTHNLSQSVQANNVSSLQSPFQFPICQCSISTYLDFIRLPSLHVPAQLSQELLMSLLKHGRKNPTINNSC